jgi:hypothetical protein
MSADGAGGSEIDTAMPPAPDMGVGAVSWSEDSAMLVDGVGASSWDIVAVPDAKLIGEGA